MPSQKATRRARNERLAAVQRQQAREDLRRNLVWIVVGILVLAGIGIGVYAGVKHKRDPNAPTGQTPALGINAPGTKLTTGEALATSYLPSANSATGGPTEVPTGTVWPLPADATPYIAAAGLTALPQETLAVHYHAHVDVIINGKTMSIPPELGYLFNAKKQPTALTSLHTHDTSGILHIESPVNKKFSLGQAFVEWGVRLTQSCIGGYCTGGTQVFKVFIDGKQYTGNPQDIVLGAHQEIALWYGDKNAKPTVPNTYSFPAGL
jgi:hypothetical protein